MVDFFQAPSVIVARLPRLWWEALGGNPFGPRESQRMVTEKIFAFHEGVFAMQIEALKSALRLSGAIARGDLEGVLAAGGSRDILQAGLKPAAKRVRRNARRLSGD